MIYTNKKELAESLKKHRITIDSMIERWEVKQVFNQKGKRVWYVKVIDFIKYLVK